MHTTMIIINLISQRKKTMLNRVKHKKIIKILFAVAVVAAVALVFFSIYRRHKEEALSEDTSFLMDTFVTQKVYGENAEQAISDSLETLHDFESLVSMYKEDSWVFKINEQAGEDVVSVDEQTYRLIESAKEYSELSNGRYDITIAPLTLAWGISGDNPQIPNDSEIERLLELVDYKDIILDKENLSVGLRDKNQSIDLGGIAKGTACDMVLDKYKQHEITSALISVGGNVAAIGTKPDGSPFVIGIRDPRGSQNDYFATFEIHDEIIATTGDYERFFEEDGIRYHHILDTDTGYPVDSDLMSVTVISKNGELSDAQSTIMFIGGVEAVMENLDNEEYSLIAVDRDKNVYISEGIEDRFEITNSDYTIISGTEGS